MVRYLEDREKLNILPLYEQCFDDDESYKRYFFEDVLPNNLVAVYEENNEISGMLQLIPKAINIGKTKSHCYYIYGVGTEESKRNKGIMQEIFANVLIDLYNNQEYFTYLIPSSLENGMIYQKMGFEYVMDKSVGIREIIRKRATHSLVLRKADFSDLSRLSIFAQSFMEGKYGIYLCKDKEYFKNMFSLVNAEKGKIELYFENKIILGYRISFEDEILEEVLDKSIEGLTWQGAKKKPYAMARILNIQDTLQALGTNEAGEVVVRLYDNVIRANNGTFIMRYDRNQIQWKETTVSPDVELTIGEFSAHVFGYALVNKLPKFNVKDGFFINDYV